MRWDFFIFTFSLLAIMVTDTAFRKSRLRKLTLFFYKKNVYKKMSLKTPQNLKKMLRRSPASNA